MTEEQRVGRGGLSLLFDRVDCTLLVYFRVVFSLVALLWVGKQLISGAVDQFYVEPRFHFHYIGFRWVELFPGNWTHVEFVVMGLAALLMLFGVFYRIASLVFALGFTHVFLGDKCLYQNHYYLICLVSWIMVFVPANCAFSVDAKFRSGLATKTIPRWVIWLLRFQIGVPYFFGGIAKVNTDWLEGEPMRLMLSRRVDMPFVGQYFAQEWCVYLMAYGALLFDLLVVPALLTRRLRWLACLFAILFHALNSWLFTIGVFPWLMLLTLPIFFPPGALRGANASPSRGRESRRGANLKSDRGAAVGIRRMAIGFSAASLFDSGESELDGRRPLLRVAHVVTRQAVGAALHSA